jgi:hypothetical protein
MHGERPSQTGFVSLIDVESPIAPGYPIRAIKRMCDEALAEMSGHFDESMRRTARRVRTGSFARGCKRI